MCSDKLLSLPYRFELAHHSLPDPSGLMRLLSPIILILLSTVYRLGYQFTMCNAITPQFICHDFPGLAAIVSYKAPEETFRCGSITLCLQVDINHLAILVNSTPQVMLLAVDLYEDFIDVEGIAVTAMLPFQSSSVYSAEFDTP